MIDGMDTLSSEWVQAASNGGSIANPGASGSVTTLTWDDSAPETAAIYTKRTYAPNKSVVGFQARTSAANTTTGDKWMGFVATDFSSAVALHCSGSGNWEYICKNPTGQTTQKLGAGDVPTSYNDYKIIWKTNASGARFYVGQNLKATITTQIPSGTSLPIFFGNR